MTLLYSTVVYNSTVLYYTMLSSSNYTLLSFTLLFSTIFFSITLLSRTAFCDTVLLYCTTPPLVPTCSLSYPILSYSSLYYAILYNDILCYNILSHSSFPPALYPLPPVYEPCVPQHEVWVRSALNEELTGVQVSRPWLEIPRGREEEGECGGGGVKEK